MSQNNQFGGRWNYRFPCKLTSRLVFPPSTGLIMHGCKFCMGVLKIWQWRLLFSLMFKCNYFEISL